MLIYTASDNALHRRGSSHMRLPWALVLKQSEGSTKSMMVTICILPVNSHGYYKFLVEIDAVTN